MESTMIRMQHNALLLCSGLLTMVLPSGCSDSDQPTEQDYDHVTSALGPLLVRDVGPDGRLVMGYRAAKGTAPAWLSVSREGGLAGEHGGLDWSVVVKCTGGSDATGCGSDAVTADVAVAVRGNLELPQHRSALAFTGKWHLDRLDEARAIAKGRTKVAARTDLSLPAIGRSFAFDLRVAYDLDVPRDEPESAVGTVDINVDVDRFGQLGARSSDAHFEIDVLVTLDGTGTADVLVDGGRSYALDLQSGTAARR
jgi:hypothetical protein